MLVHHTEQVNAKMDMVCHAAVSGDVSAHTGFGEDCLLLHVRVQLLVYTGETLEQMHVAEKHATDRCHVNCDTDIGQRPLARDASNMYQYVQSICTHLSTPGRAACWLARMCSLS